MAAQSALEPRILLVDDDPVTIRLLAAALQEEYRVSFSTGGEEALRMVATRAKPDLILLDVQMPDIDGFVVCDRLKSDPETRDIPIMFVTALHDGASEAKGLEAGAVDYIYKPITPTVVLARVKRQLELEHHREFMQALLERRSEDLKAANVEVGTLIRSLREREATLTAFLDNAPQALTLKDVKGRYLMANAVAARRAGLTVEQMLGKTNEELDRWHAATRMTVTAHERQVIETGGTVSEQRTEVEMDGKAFSLLVTQFPVFGEAGEVVAVGAINTDMTEQKTAEAALRESEESFRRLVQGSLQGIVIHRKGKPVFANQAYADILGFESPEAVLDLDSLADVYAPHEHDRLWDYQRARLRGDDAPSHYEADAIRRDGTPITLQCTVNPITWKGEPSFQLAVIDITERKVAERALRESEERFRDYAESSSDWLWEADATLEVTSAIGPDSRRWAMPDVPRLMLRRESGGDPEDVAANPEKWEKVWRDVEGRRPFRHFEFPVRDRAGRIRHIRTSGKPVTDREGRFTGYRGVASDVTEIVESQRQATTLRDAIDVSELGVALYDREQRIVFTNDAYHAVFRALPPKEELVGMPREAVLRKIIETSSPQHPVAELGPEAYLEAMLQRVPKREALSDEVSYANGRTYLRRYRSTDAGGALVLLTDITERKRAEEQLEDHQARLRRLAAEVSLAEERERRRIAVELHDGAVQNLGLSRIKLGTLYVKLKDGAHAERLESIRALVDQSIRELRSLMSELSPPMLYELGLTPAVEWLAERFQELHGLRCRLELDEDSTPLATDVQVSLFQAVRELLMNVVKHAKATQVVIGIHRVDDRLRIQVADDGVGLEPGRVGRRPSDAGGFGLFNLRERVGLMGGGVDFQSDGGAVVTLSVPLDSAGPGG